MKSLVLIARQQTAAARLKQQPFSRTVPKANKLAEPPHLKKCNSRLEAWSPAGLAVHA